MDEIGIKQSPLAEAVGISQGAISQILNGTTQNSTYLPAIAEYLAINLSWLRGSTDEKISLFDDEGQRITEDEFLKRKGGFASPKISFKAMPTSLQSPELSAEQLGSVLIPQLEIGYSMGGGSVFEDYQQTAMVPFPRDWLRPMIKGRFDELFVARGDGDSMMPTLLDGDLVIVDTAQKDVLQQDRLWCLSYGELGMIKRVRKLPDGGYQINSDNPNVTAITAYDGELHVVGRVIWIGRRV